MTNAFVAKLLLILAVFCLAVAWIITADWVTAHGAARDEFLVGGLTLFAASFLP